jgi:hypothetical protein
MAGWQNDLAPHWIGKEAKQLKKLDSIKKHPLHKQTKKEKINKDGLCPI